MSESDAGLASNGRRPTIVDVARRAAVSVATVSNALNRRHVEADTRARVMAAVLALGYTPNLRARRLRTGRADTIAIFSSMSFAIAGGRARMGFLMELAASAAVQALQSGIALVLVPPLEKARPPIEELHIDGALVIEPLAGDLDVALLQARGIPVVAIGRQLEANDIPFVDLHSYDATRLLLDHLGEQSARQISLVIGAQPRNSYVEAERAYRDFALAHGMPPLIVRVDETGGEAAAEAATRTLLAEHPEIDAICAPVDVFAVGAAAAAQQAGRRIPDDLKLVTRYDGVLARESNPKLTALDLNLDEVAVLGVELLLEHLQGDKRRSVVAGPRPKLVPRASSIRGHRVGSAEDKQSGR